MIRRTILMGKLSLDRTANSLLSFFHPPTMLQLAMAPSCNANPSTSLSSSPSEMSTPSWTDCLWLAVPKRKVTPGKKRMKTTNQKRIKKKNHIIVDSRTGEITLRHRLPFNWKDYLPGADSETGN
jgi:ribosomal protein L32